MVIDTDESMEIANHDSPPISGESRVCADRISRFRHGLEDAGFRVFATESLWDRFGRFNADRR